MVLASSGPVNGRVVVIDPGHNGANQSHPQEINRQVPAGNGKTKSCDTTGTATDAGYPEYAFSMDVALRVAAILRQHRVTVILTRSDSSGVGPCVDRRAQIGNDAHAAAAISIHADGAPAADYGYHVIWPSPSDKNAAIVDASHALAIHVRDYFKADSGEPISTYVRSGLTQRGDLAGLNLSTVPKVFIECANMRNAGDAARITAGAWRQKAAQGIADGLLAFIR